MTHQNEKRMLSQIRLREAIKKLLPQFIIDLYFANKVKQWRKQGCHVPPPDYIKQQRIKRYAKDYDLKILVETGTYRGDTIAAVKNDFDKVYSIELGEQLAEMAKKRFAHDSKVEILYGNSKNHLPNIIDKLDRPSLFWLDAHYSGGITAQAEETTPIIDELNIIFTKEEFQHIILIDDARLFGNDPGYPLLEVIYKLVDQTSQNRKIIIENDCICIVPKEHQV